MSTVMPSQVCAFIESEFAFVGRERHLPTQSINLTDQVCASLRALIVLIESIPPALMPSDPADFVTLTASVAYIKSHLFRAESLDARTRSARGDPVLHPSTSESGWSPVRVIERVLKNCLDEVSPVASRDFSFIKDLEVRAELLSDLISARSALLNLEWKPATVMAGSLAEALLLWTADQRVADLRVACEAAVTKGLDNRALNRDRELWGLQELIGVVAELGVIEPDTLNQLKIAQDFRNLIHRGRTRRISKRCDRGTALATNAAVELLSRDLQVKFP